MYSVTLRQRGAALPQAQIVTMDRRDALAMAATLQRPLLDDGWTEAGYLHSVDGDRESWRWEYHKGGHVAELLIQPTRQTSKTL